MMNGTVILCDRIITRLSTPLENKGGGLHNAIQKSIRTSSDLHAGCLGLDRRKARQNRLKNEEICAKLGKRTTNWEISSRSKLPFKATDRPHQKLEVSKTANASTFRQEKRSIHGQGHLSKSILCMKSRAF